MKILLVNPKIYPVRRVPLGLAYIAAVLKKENYNVKVYDPIEHKDSEFKNLLLDYKPDVVGYTSTTPQSVLVKRLSHIVKASLPNTYNIVGGVHATEMPKDLLSDKSIDFTIIGEGELTVLELIKHLEHKIDLKDIKGLAYRKDNTIHFNEPRPLIENLDTLPFPARDLFNMDYVNQKNIHTMRGLWLKSLSVMTSRGCPFRCIYCASKTMWSRRARQRSSKNIVNEIEHLLSKYNVEGIMFIDDTFTLNRERVFEICDEIKRRNLKFKLQINSRVNTIDEEIIKALKSVGLIQVTFGVESGSRKILKVLKKDTTPEQAITAFRLCQKHGIGTVANFMIGNPEETLKDIEETVNHAKKLNATFTDIFITTPFPNTELWYMAVKNKWINQSDYSKMLIG
ncbi:MAG: radical SAM protein, partial [Candidatus Woesearchaeota archaeon]|nr:radical SAM protein [Candidatus Woesearchaeota archaeon]